MYRRPKFLEVLIQIREEMAREADFDSDLFGEIVTSGRGPRSKQKHSLAEDRTNGNSPHKASRGTKRSPGRLDKKA